MEIKRCYDTIIGASVGENQLVQSGDTSVTVPNGHKYYSKINDTETLGASTGTAIAINDSAKDMVTDLTQKLGSAIADYVYGLGTSSGIAKLREWGFLRGYQAFNAGSIESVEATAHKMVGFNQWDEEWEVGGIKTADGTAVTASAVRSKNFMPILPNVTYFSKSPTNISNFVFFYDGNMEYISYAKIVNASFVTPSNARYFKIQLSSATPYNHDVCINLSSSRNGEYEPYSAHTYDLGTDTLRGLFKLDSNNNLYADGDRKASDGTVTRKYGIVDLGTLDWTDQSTETQKSYYSAVVSDAMTAQAGTPANIVVVGYNPTGHNGFVFDMGDKAITISSSKRININDNAYADATTFKQAMSGVMLVYELATPTTETSTPFQSPQVCYPDGTEEYVTSNGVPVGHETRYEL